MTTSPLETYLHALWAIRNSGAAVPETSGYGTLATLLDSVGAELAPKVRTITGIRQQGAGLPDVGMFTADQLGRGDASQRTGQTPARGVIEVKSTRDDVVAIAASAQVRGYLGRYGLVLVTNYRDFLLVDLSPDGTAHQLERYSLATSEQEFWATPIRTLVERHAAGLHEYLLRVMLRAAPIRTPRDLAFLLASYARDARARVERQRDLPTLLGLRSSLEQALGITFAGERGEHFFRSTLVQTLFYGLFSAWVLWHAEQPDRNERFSWRFAGSYLHLPVLQSLFGQLAQSNRLRALDLLEVLEWADAALGRVDRAAFFAAFVDAEAVQYFYEPFLAAFDPELRRELGVWYTPREIVRYQVERVDRVLREELGVADGLADPHVVVLDPCCGTGAYLVEVVDRIARTLRERGDDDLLAADVKRAVQTRLYGFELLPAPFVVAHLQIGLLLQRLGASFGIDERAAIYLTNALTGWEPPTGPRAQLMFPELADERDAATSVKGRGDILVVLGNPPYSGYAGIARIEEERDLSHAYRTTKAAPAPQGQGLNDLYIRFFRMAERQIVESSKRGVVCYISNYSWLDGRSFTGMRERYLEVFDTIWIDSLNGDKYKTGKLTPEGAPDPSVFSTEFNREGIQVGTAIAMLVRHTHHQITPHVRFRHFWGRTKRADLLASLTDAEHMPYQSVTPALPIGLPFVPTTTSADYLTWPLLPELFPTSFPGIQTGRDDVLVDTDRAQLEQRMRQYFDPAINHEQMRQIAPGVMEDSARFSAVATRELLRKRGFLPENIVRYAYRPFDARWLYWEPETKLLDEKRSEYFTHVLFSNYWLAAVVQNRRDFDPPIVAQSYIARHIIERGANLFPLYLHPEPPAQIDMFAEATPADPTPQPNLSALAQKALASLGGEAPDLFFHTIAVLHAPAYRSENAGALRQDWPRIPLPASAAALSASATLGRRVAALLDVETAVVGVTSGAVPASLRELGRLRRADGSAVQVEAGDLALAAGWGFGGRGGIVMPGKGRVTERDFTAEELAALGESAGSLDGSTLDIWLNERTCWRNVPLATWEYTIGGYQVIKKWLSYREKALLGRDLTPDEARHVTQMIRRITALLLLGPALDASYRVVAG